MRYLGAVICLREIDLREIRLALREPFRISSGVVSERRILLLTLYDENGEHAWSECVAGEFPNYSAETIETAWLALEQWIAPRVLGRALDVGALYDELESDIRGHEMAKAALEMGCWALRATQSAVSRTRSAARILARTISA